MYPRFSLNNHTKKKETRVKNSTETVSRPSLVYSSLVLWPSLTIFGTENMDFAVNTKNNNNDDDDKKMLHQTRMKNSFRSYGEACSFSVEFAVGLAVREVFKC